MNSMKIYFCGSIRGGRQDANIYYQLVKYLRSYGEVLTEHVGSSVDVNKCSMDKDRGLTEKEIHDRDMNWLEASDVVVAEVTTPSLGVGYEIGSARLMGKKILCLFRELSDGKRLSAMIDGAKDGDMFQVHYYSTIEQAQEKIDEMLSKHKN